MRERGSSSYYTIHYNILVEYQAQMDLISIVKYMRTSEFLSMYSQNEIIRSTLESCYLNWLLTWRSYVQPTIGLKVVSLSICYLSNPHPHFSLTLFRYTLHASQPT